MRSMRPLKHSLRYAVLCTLLVFSQWVAAGHSIDLDAGHIHGIDCAVCAFEKLGQAAVSATDPVQFEPILQALYLIPHAAVVGTAIERQSIRAPPC